MTLYYPIERILDKLIDETKVYYLVKWESYPISQSTWEDGDILLQDCKHIVDEYEISINEKVSNTITFRN